MRIRNKTFLFENISSLKNVINLFQEITYYLKYEGRIINNLN